MDFKKRKEKRKKKEKKEKEKCDRRFTACSRFVHTPKYITLNPFIGF